MNSKSRYYEAYWSMDGLIPNDDTTTKARKQMLATALGRFLTHDRRGKVLDAGCGNGEFSILIKKLGFEAVGLDISEAALEKAKKRSPTTSFYSASLEDALPFDDETFDAIWCTEVLEHLFDVHACLANFNRILHGEGILVLTVPFHGLLKNLIIALMGFEKHYNPSVSHIRFFTKRSLTDCLLRTGFDAVLWRGIGRMWPVHKSFFVVARKVSTVMPASAIIG